MMTKDKISHAQAVDALRRGLLVSVPYHVEGYGPGRGCHMWGDPVIGEANGPEGYLHIGLDDAGDIIIDEWDDEVCHPDLHGLRVNGAGRVVTTDEET